jgi:dihydrofolate reductase
MKITIVMLTSLNGVITSGPDDDLSWGGSLDKKNFSAHTKATGTVVMGSKTFEAIGHSLPGRRNIVLTSRTSELASKYTALKDIEFSSLSPVQLVSKLEAEGLSHIALIGGSQLNTSFLEAGLVTNLRLTIAPAIIPGSTGVFAQSLSRNYLLELTNQEQLADGAIVLEYTLKQSAQTNPSGRV